VRGEGTRKEGAGKKVNLVRKTREHLLGNGILVKIFSRLRKGMTRGLDRGAITLTRLRKIRKQARENKPRGK